MLLLRKTTGYLGVRLTLRAEENESLKMMHTSRTERTDKVPSTASYCFTVALFGLEAAELNYLRISVLFRQKAVT